MTTRLKMIVWIEVSNIWGNHSLEKRKIAKAFWRGGKCKGRDEQMLRKIEIQSESFNHIFKLSNWSLKLPLPKIISLSLII